VGVQITANFYCKGLQFLGSCKHVMHKPHLKSNLENNPPEVFFKTRLNFTAARHTATEEVSPKSVGILNLTSML